MRALRRAVKTIIRPEGPVRVTVREGNPRGKKMNMAGRICETGEVKLVRDSDVRKTVMGLIIRRTTFCNLL